MSVNSVNPQTGELTRVAGGTLYADLAVGSIVPFGGSTAPSGFLLCQGQAVSRTTYAELFAVIGTAYGKGDNSTTFNVPDLREAVPKGVGLNGRSSVHYDENGVALGEFIEDRVQDHLHRTKLYNQNFQVGSENAAPVTENGGSGVGTVGDIVVGRHGATNEVKAVGVNYIIKAKQVAVPFDVAEYVKAYNSPDWDNAINISSNLSTTDYTITDDGWITGIYYATGGNPGVSLTLNGIPIASAGNATSYGWYGQCMAKVSKGDKVKFNKSGFGSPDIYFVPHK